jgi:hypothetical protein
VLGQVHCHLPGEDGRLCISGHAGRPEACRDRRIDLRQTDPVPMKEQLAFHASPFNAFLIQIALAREILSA